MPLVMPILHPGAIFRGQEVEDASQVTYLKRALAVAKGYESPHLKTTKNPPGSIVYPTLADVERFDALITDSLKLYGDDRVTLAIDIESAGQYITLIGVALVDLSLYSVNSILSLPFRVRGGHDYWKTWEEHCEVVALLYSWLADPRVAKVFHNGISYDVPELERHGFVVRGTIYDTLIMQHYAYPEMRKGLQYCATLYCGAPVWKDLGEEE